MKELKKRIPLKYIYVLSACIAILLSVGLYYTYAMFTANVSSGNVVNMDTTLKYNFDISGTQSFHIGKNSIASFYATINNGIASIDYELSSSIGAKNYTLTAVAMDKTYNRIETNTTLTLEKHNTQVILQPQYLNRSKNAIIKAKIIDEEGNLVIGTTKVAIKLNNKTITHAIAVNGILNATLDLSIYKQSLFNLTIVAGENKLYNSSKSTNALIIE